MITYINEKAIIEPSEVSCDFSLDGIDTAVTAFSDFIFDVFREKYKAVKIGEISGGAGYAVYRAEVRGKRVAVYKSSVGAPAAAAAMEEIGAVGIKNFVAFGICGALVTVPPRTFIVPNRAFRDEGTSYHYLPPSDSIEIKNSGVVARSLERSGISVMTGATWTTDGFYRETRTRAEQMKSNGCVAVDMECAALQAVCDYRKKNFYTFFISADSLAGEKWEPNYILDPNVTSVEQAAVAAAAALASEL
ncbi:MAG: nucleoside phosphorylase [Roseburia sp.]|nr:nucleoside phosphorylase [Roseburia sp.]